MIVQDGLGQVYYFWAILNRSTFPPHQGAFDPTYNGGNGDSFIVKLALAYTPAQASFSGSPTSGIAPLNVTFTNLSTGDFDTCAWDFGDGSSSNNCSDQPTHSQRLGHLRSR
ncbi:MAG: PKD domain-containing protein [Chloroflexi bacterium]|nr:PKD domain-containing protein [Chloroflexota bacterium]